MTVNRHGGQCCGATHVFAFPSYISDKAAWLKKQIDATQAKSNVNPRRVRSHLIEVILTDQQMISWAETLKDYGFSLHTRWFNSNSRNHCNLLTYQTRKPRIRCPYTW